jgi:hypothetical protein
MIAAQNVALMSFIASPRQKRMRRSYPTKDPAEPDTIGVQPFGRLRAVPSNVEGQLQPDLIAGK